MIADVEVTRQSHVYKFAWQVVTCPGGHVDGLPLYLKVCEYSPCALTCPFTGTHEDDVIGSESFAS